MSRPSASTSRPIFASKTVYDALGVESGEDISDEDEAVDSPSSESQQASLKPSKSALKKAAKLARIERKQRQKERKAHGEHPIAHDLSRTAPSSTSHTAGLPDTSDSHEVVDTAEHETTSEPLDAPPVSSTATSTPSVLPVQTETVKQMENGHQEKQNGHASPILDLPAVSESSNLDKRLKEKELPNVPDLRETALAQVDTTTSEEKEKVKKRQSFITRTLWTFIMIGGFISLLLLGHSYMILLVMLCETLVYREITALFSLKNATPESGEAQPVKKSKDPWSKTLNWYFFAVTNYFLYGESIIYYFKHVVFADAQLLPFATNHRMISFTLYILGFMGFVMSLKKGYLKQQFGLFCWVHMTLLLIVVSSHFIMNNILEGLIWFFVPASLVICNDVFAYIWGITIGRTPLIKLSPKKTVEGFVGAFVTTLLFAVLWGTFFMRFNYMICPVHDLGVSAWSHIQCKPNPVFVWRSIAIWSPVATMLSTLLGRSVTTISYAPYQLHLLVLACFASLVAPFGGFFASGFKRAFNIKDFGHSIPGHGGMTDRMDCQFLMGVFTYVYYSSLIREHNVTVGGVLQTIVSGLSVDEQLELIADLTRYLQKQGIPVPRLVAA